MAKYFDNGTLPEVNTARKPNLPAFELIDQMGDRITMPHFEIPRVDSRDDSRDDSLDLSSSEPHSFSEFKIFCITTLSVAIGILLIIAVFSCWYCYRRRARTTTSGKRKLIS